MKIVVAIGLVRRFLPPDNLNSDDHRLDGRPRGSTWHPSFLKLLWENLKEKTEVIDFSFEINILFPYEAMIQGA